MRWLVTLAEQGKEPYWSGALALREFASSIGWASGSVADLQGDRPWQAKRFALRAAFGAGAERVFYCDSDIVIRRPDVLARVLNQEGRSGVWAQYAIPMDGYFERQQMRHGPGIQARVVELYQSICRAYGFTAGEAPHFSDWFVGYQVSPEIGLRMCDVWDEVAQSLLSRGLTWSDGVSIGIAAKACGVTIRHCLRHRDISRALQHLRNGDKHGYFAKPGECQP